MISVLCVPVQRREVSDVLFDFCVWFWVPCRGDVRGSYSVRRVAGSDPFKFQTRRADCENACKGVNEAERETS